MKIDGDDVRHDIVSAFPRTDRHWYISRTREHKPGRPLWVGPFKTRQEAEQAAERDEPTARAEIRLFVDDERNPEQFGLTGWTVARTSSEAIAILAQGSVVECSLDHDLGGDDTGYKVACWMEENGVWPKEGVRCHSANPVGRQRIEAVINRA